MKDVLNASKRLSARIALAEEIAPHVAEEIIRILVHAEYLQEIGKALHRVRIEGPDAIARANIVAEKRYKIAPRRLGEMVAVAAELEADLPSGPGSGSTLVGGKPTSIGKFKIIRVIGRGGMGTAYEATDEHTGLKVAVKVSLDSANDELLGRFEREALIMKKLNHPNIVRLLDFGRDNGRLYIAMEYLDGITLEGILNQRGRLRVELAVAIAKPVAEAADYVHGQGIVRNDIKPGNIILTTAGRVCLLDFGISRPMNPDTYLLSKFDTKADIIIGTPQFMAPEQLEHHTADVRSDIYSLGVMLYKMLTGVFPFEGPNIVAVVRAQIQDVPVPPSRHVKSLPHSIDDVVMKCLEKDPNNRFQKMEELSVELSNIVKGFPQVDLKSEVNVVAKKAIAVAKMDEVVTLEPSLIVPVSPPTMGSAIPSPIAAKGPPSWVSAPRRAAASMPAAPIDASGPLFYSLDDFKPIDNQPRLTLLRGDPNAVMSNITHISSEHPTYVLDPEATIGRGSDNSISLHDARVSRYQAALKLQNGLWFIEDFNANLGTRVNGERIIVPRLLRDRRPNYD